MIPTNKTVFPYSYRQVPLFPIYGYESWEDSEKDFDYMKQLYPRSTVRIQELIEEACDRLEYEGSIMFDEYPDRLQVSLLAGKIYSQVMPTSAAECQDTVPDKHSPDWLRSMIEIMLCSEMCQRRRRYRSRKRWI